jgi:hypothetical protein
MTGIDGPVCPRCGMGFDTNGDGNCVVCWSLPDAQARLIGSMAERISALQKLLKAASHALRSYQYGNSATELAEEMANTVDAALAPQVKP